MKTLNFLRHLAYGAFIEKIWQVSVLTDIGCGSPAKRVLTAINENGLSPVSIPPQFRFLADPIFYDDDTVLAEGLRRGSEKGRIVAIKNGTVSPLQCEVLSHLSYPCSIEEGGQTYIVPEMTRGGAPHAFALIDAALKAVAPLKIDSGPLLDPTLIRHQGRLYLFANRVQDGPGTLRLWSADGLFEHFEEHPSSPVRSNRRGSRMGGKLFQDGDTLYRFGQDFRQSYGDGLLCFRVDRLSTLDYAETLVESITLSSAKGPHTLEIRAGRMVLDWYVEKFSLFAWARRIASRIG